MHCMYKWEQFIYSGCAQYQVHHVVRNIYSQFREDTTIASSIATPPLNQHPWMGVSQTETLIGCNQQTWGSNMLLKTRKRGYFTNKNINNNYTKHTSCMMQLGTLILFCSPCILKNIWMNIYKYRLLYMAYAVYIYITWVKYHNISLI